MHQSMKDLLNAHKIHDFDQIPPNKAYPIWEKTDPHGRKYWGVSNFCGKDRDIAPDQDLSMLEWDGNELYFDAQIVQEIPRILKQAIGLFRAWNNQIQQTYPNTTFHLFAYYCDGRALLDEGEIPIPSITLRLWAEHIPASTVIDPDVDIWEQPVMHAICNP